MLQEIPAGSLAHVAGAVGALGRDPASETYKHLKEGSFSIAGSSHLWMSLGEGSGGGRRGGRWETPGLALTGPDSDDGNYDRLDVGRPARPGSVAPSLEERHSL